MSSINIRANYKKEYTCCIERNIWSRFLKFCEAHYSNRKIFIIIDENVNRLHGNEIQQQCGRYFTDCHVLEVPPGETSKSRQVWKQLTDRLLNKGLERTTPLLAVGGGVTGDVAGFTAATALRGVPLVHMPTTLLAMVDSSVGGKTGINHGKGKNLIGSFYQPDAVFSHLPFLETLPGEEWVNGLSEVLKYAAIAKPELFDALETAVKEFEPNKQWKQIIVESVQIKGAIVEADTREAGKRAVLNFGHTFGHALEKRAGFEAVSHGEAVFAGMLAAAFISGKTNASVDGARFYPFKALYDIQLPDRRAIDTLIDLMYADKKVKNGWLHLVLLNKWGEPVVEKIEDKHLLRDAWRHAFSVLNSDLSMDNHNFLNQ